MQAHTLPADAGGTDDEIAQTPSEVVITATGLRYRQTQGESMPRAYVFLVHGVGSQAVGSWSDGWQEALCKALCQYAPYNVQSPEDIRRNTICFVPISYDRVFDGYRKRWTNLAGALADSEVLSEGPLTDALRAIENDEDQGVSQAFWSHALDAVLWYGLPQARAAVIASVLDQIVQGVKQMLADNHSADHAHIVAHSLGTSVLHDALISLRFAEHLHEGAFDPANFKWQSISMVANTSRLLHAWKPLSSGIGLEQFHPYRSVCRPGAATSITRSYHNFHHRLDPITWPKQFLPMDFTNGYADIETQHFNDPSRIHDFTHYIDNPLVHLRMLRSFLGNAECGNADEVNRIAKSFVKRCPLTGTKPFAELRALFGDDSDRPQTVAEVAKFLSHAFKAIKAIKAIKEAT